MSGPSGGYPDSDSAWRPPVTPVAGPPEQLAGYDGLVEVGHGGDSVVYRARELALSRDVAIKVLEVADDVRAERFAREIAITVDLGRRHPNIVNVLAIGTTASGRPAIVMDFYDLGSLADQLRSLGPLPVDEVVKIGTVLADALAFAHAEGILHRDVKPQNVLRLPTSWVLADFGIARMAGSEHTASVETFTYRHASPQILDGYQPTAADDVWSLGSTLYTLVDGRPPFTSEDPDDDSALAYLRRARTEPHRPLLVPGAESLAEVIDRCLAKDVADRWPSAEALRDALGGLVVTAWTPEASRPRAEPGGPTAAADEPRRARILADDPSIDNTTPRTRIRARRRPDPTPPLPLAAPAPPEPAPPAPVSPAPVSPAPVSPVAPADPVALSVLAHATPRRTDPDTTGVGPAPVPATAGAAAPPESPTPATGPVVPDEAPDGSRRRKRIVAVLAVVALIVGIVLAGGGTILRRHASDPVARTPTTSGIATGEPVPTLSSKPIQSGPPQVQVVDPKLAFLFSDLDVGLVTTKVGWQDTTQGQGTFTLVETYPKRALWNMGVGDSGTADLATVLGKRYCFQLTVVLPDGDLGTSQNRCQNAHD